MYPLYLPIVILRFDIPYSLIFLAGGKLGSEYRMVLNKKVMVTKRIALA